MSLDANSDARIEEQETFEGGRVLKAVPARPAPAREEKPAPDPEQEAPARRGRGFSPKTMVVGLVVLVALGAAGWFGYGYWTNGRFMVTTDDAYVHADIAEISPKIQGYVADIAVHENQHVKAGDVILTLDDGDYRIALQSAQSRIDTQKETLKRIEAQVGAAKAAVEEAQAQKAAAEAKERNARQTEERVQSLVKKGVSTQSQLDEATSGLDQAQAAVAAANAAVSSAEANVSVLQAQYAETASKQRDLELAVQQAQRNLDLTVLRAPFDGVVTNVSAELGDLVSPGSRLAAVVPSDGLYVEANYKETQLADIAPGADAAITFDALPDRTFEGKVVSTAPATGAMFSLLPPENATGNFTKVVQRVPVRISIPEVALETGRLRAGLSAVVAVDSRTGGRAVSQ